ncbi:MAG TPA: hypothetical protein VHF69_08280, partial [Candidatus Synoicihabitans sp.]|nr:hypothetical protein [Candidatus Synoicihabitans sp.]
MNLRQRQRRLSVGVPHYRGQEVGTFSPGQGRQSRYNSQAPPVGVSVHELRKNRGPVALARDPQRMCR